MKNIYFDTMKNWIWIVILILSLVFILVGSFDIFQFENPNSNKRISGVGFLLQVIYFSRMFWYKNYVQWNKKGAVIRINSFTAKSLRFDQIKSTELNDNKLTVTRTNGNKVTFDLNEIAQSDTQKLNALIVKNTIVSSQ